MGGCALWTQACVRHWPAVGGRGPKDDSGWPPYRRWSPLLSALRRPARYHTCMALLSGPLWGWEPSGGEDLVERPRPSGGGKSASRHGVGCGPGLRMDRITEASSRPDGGLTELQSSSEAPRVPLCPRGQDCFLLCVVLRRHPGPSESLRPHSQPRPQGSPSFSLALRAPPNLTLWVGASVTPGCW